MQWILIILLPVVLSACVSSGKYKDLEKKYKGSVSTGNQLAQDKKNLLAEKEDLQFQVDSQNTLINQLKSKLGESTENIEEMRSALKEAAERKKETEKRIKEYSRLISRFRKLIDAGKLSVKIDRGRMIVQLDSDILFSSGSSRLSTDGKLSITEVAQVLMSIPNREYQIEGHTDNVPIKTAKFPSNWELAASRATNVMYTMLDAGLSPQRISVASFGEYHPINDNSDKDKKAANRRIEIVVMPDLSSLPGFEELNKLGTAKN